VLGWNLKKVGQMMYCVNCENPVTRLEVDNRKCSHCGKDPAHEQKSQPKSEGEYRDDYYRNKPIDSDPQTIRAHMWMME